MSDNANMELSYTKKSTTLYFIKLGGSLITDKKTARTPNISVIQNCLSQIKRALAERTNLRVILAHGQGSFAHIPAKKYSTHLGLISPQSQMGYALTQHEVVQLNQIVIAQGLELDIPLIPFFPSCTVMMSDRSTSILDPSILEASLERGFIPISTGDVVIDTERGCGIWSADRVLPEYALALKTSGWKVKEIIHATITPGVFHDFRNPSLGIIPEITPQSYQLLSSQVGEAEATDVTGGMRDKVKLCVDIADKGIPSVILHPEYDAIYHELTSGTAKGTRIRSDAMQVASKS